MDKRVVLTGAVVMASLALSGCSATLRTFVNSGLQSQVDARVNQNIACVEQLKTAGLLSSDKADDIKVARIRCNESSNRNSTVWGL